MASYLQASLPSLPEHLQTENQLTSHLASRYHANLPISRLSTQGIISINTYTTSTTGKDGQKEGSAMAEADELAGKSLARMAARGENQAVIFLGESGSGKTTFRRHLLSSLLAISSTPLSTKISLAAFIFESLTTTKSVTTPIASKAGLFLELQYDSSSMSRPLLLGGKIIDHRLERSRIASVPTGERSFHVLYYLLAGTSDAEKRHLGLNTPSIITEQRVTGHRGSISFGQRRWRYLGHPTQLKVGIDDAQGFQHFKTALRKLEFTRNDIAEICQILAAILHLGQLEFIKSQTTTPAADESGGYSHEGGEDITVVKNKDILAIIAAFLGLNASDLEASLGYKTKNIRRERVTIMLDPAGARANADELARTLYSLLVAYIVEHCNQRICADEDSIANTLSLVDFPGFQQSASTGSVLDQLLNNAACESMHNHCLHRFFENKVDQLGSEEVQIPATSYFDNSDAVKGLLKHGNGLLSILDDQTKRGRTDQQFLQAVRKRFQESNPAISASAASVIQPGANFATRNTAAAFTVKHHAGEVDYPIDGLIEANGEVVAGDMMNLINSTKSNFVSLLFGQETLKTTMHPQEKTAVMQAQVSSKPLRMPSTVRRGNKRPERFTSHTMESTEQVKEPPVNSQPTDRKGNSQLANLDHGASGQFLSSLDIIKKTLMNINTNAYFVFCLKPNDRRMANHFDSICVRSQLRTFGIAEISHRLHNADFSVFLPFSEFLGLASANAVQIGSEREKAESVIAERQWPDREARAGNTGVFLSERCWLSIADLSDTVNSQQGISKGETFDDEDLSPAEHASNPFIDSQSNLLGGQSADGAHHRKQDGYFPSRDVYARSTTGLSAFNGDLFQNHETREQMAERGNQKNLTEVEDVVVSGSRKRWLAIVWILTFWVPEFMIKLVGKIKRPDVRMAWREKLAINLLIWLSCGFVVFFLLFFPGLICPKQNVFSSDELQSHNGKSSSSSYVAIRGGVYDLGAFIPNHYPNIVPQRDLQKYAGLDVTDLFPVQVSALCRGPGNTAVNPYVTINANPVNISGNTAVISGNDPNANYHDFRAFTNDSRPYWFTEQMQMFNKNYKVGNVGYSAYWVGQLAGKSATSNTRIINNRVYDLTNYINGAARIKLPSGSNGTAGSGTGTQFIDDSIVRLFSTPNIDITAQWNALQMDPVDKSAQKICLDNLFFEAVVDTRNSVQCQFANYLLLAVTILLVSVIGFKFLAALQFGEKTEPEKLDQWVICQIPAYTEDEDALRRAIDSAARMEYDDKRKLLVIICDGMIIGQGNDRPTPRIVLDILGVTEDIDPEPLSFESLGEGMKQHNMGKVYPGLYEVRGHIVPFLVIVKVGKPSEVARPGNRGKRDSQMLLMRFLNRVHYNLPMNPLELEMYHQIKNVIGVNPTFYEFLFQIDADTVVAPDSATRMIAAFNLDSRLIGVCGETALTNAKSSMVTMMQVYEYYISHNLTKAFESLFGSVTCLPGCFSMYRVRSVDTNRPLFVSREVVEAYSTIRVDTLHMKNLLHLGEDRYLTTLLMKCHSKYKTKYLRHAHASTVAPDSWKVFLSQRRRWINSTVHNLIELIPLTQLCGFCCFSMRFVVFVDLLSTIVQPVTVFYIGWLIAEVATNSTVVPLTAFILLAAIYGLQAIIFILRRKWEMIGWMIIYVLAMPVFSFALPLYSFWYMDDFSWGNTRVVTGEQGRKIVVTDEGKFDPNSIPRKTWADYQNELLEASSQIQHDDTRSEVSGISYGTRRFAATELGSRSMSRLQPPIVLDQSSRNSVAGSEILNSQGYDEQNRLSGLNGIPSDDELLAEIRQILRTTDLMNVTKKSTRQMLEYKFGVGLESKKAYISAAIEAIVTGQL